MPPTRPQNTATVSEYTTIQPITLQHIIVYQLQYNATHHTNTQSRLSEYTGVLIGP